MRLYDYIREEVRRGHDVTRAEGQLRIAWMWEAWEWAQARAQRGLLPTREDVEAVGRLIEPALNARVAVAPSGYASALVSVRDPTRSSRNWRI